MRVLLDTHVLLWTLSGSRRVAAIETDILSPDTDVFISVVSLWEIAIKAKLGKLDADVETVRQAIKDSGFVELPVLGAHIVMLAKLSSQHKDPFDRLLVAQAVSEPMQFITADKVLGGYSELVRVI